MERSEADVFWVSGAGAGVEFAMTIVLKHAAFIERLAGCILYIQANDGAYYRPNAGWPVRFVYDE